MTRIDAVSKLSHLNSLLLSLGIHDEIVNIEYPSTGPVRVILGFSAFEKAFRGRKAHLESNRLTIVYEQVRFITYDPARKTAVPVEQVTV